MKKSVPLPAPPPKLEVPVQVNQASPSATMSKDKFIKGLDALAKIERMLETTPGLADVH